MKVNYSLTLPSPPLPSPPLPSLPFSQKPHPNILLLLPYPPLPLIQTDCYSSFIPPFIIKLPQIPPLYLSLSLSLSTIKPSNLSLSSTIMSSTAPPILPISAPTTTPATIPTISTTTTTATSSDPPIATPAFRAFIIRLSDKIKDGLSQSRPWSELSDRSAFTKPESLSDATTRIRRNYAYFRVNYLFFLALILLFSLLTHPFSLLTLSAIFAAWCFLYLFKPADRPVVLFGRTFSDRETLGILVISSVFIIFLTNVGSVILSALLVGVAVVCLHGAFRKDNRR